MIALFLGVTALAFLAGGALGLSARDSTDRDISWMYVGIGTILLMGALVYTNSVPAAN